MSLPAAIPVHRRLVGWTRSQAAYCLPGALVALALTLPMYRKLLLWHRGPEEVYYELRDGFAYLSDIPTFVAIGAWLLTPFRQRVRGLPLWLTASLAALAVLATLSASWSSMPSTTLYHAARLWLFLAVYLVIATTPEARGALAWGMVVSGALQAAIGIAQSVHQGSLGLAALGEVTLDPAWSGSSVLTVGGVRVLRAYGLTQHPNLLGGILAVATLVGAGLVLGRRGWPRPLALGLSALCFAGMLFTFSRAAWLGFAVAVVVGLGLWGLRTWNQRPRTRGGRLAWVRVRGISAPGARDLWVLCLVLAVVGLVFVGTQWPLLQPRLGLSVEGVEIRSVDERAGLETAAWTLVRDRPWLGVGYADFSVALWLRRPEVMAAYPVYQPVHKAPLLAAAELGIPGGVLWLTLAAGPWVAIWARRRTWPGGGVPPATAIATSASLALLTVVSWFDFYPWSGHPGRLLSWILWGLWAQTAAGDWRRSRGGEQP